MRVEINTRGGRLYVARGQLSSLALGKAGRWRLYGGLELSPVDYLYDAKFDSWIILRSGWMGKRSYAHSVRRERWIVLYASFGDNLLTLGVLEHKI